MPMSRPRAKSLSIPIPTVGLWRLCRPPTPRRATYPFPRDYDTPPVPSLSFWDPETPSPLPTSSPSGLRADSGIPQTLSSSPSSCYSQPEHHTRTINSPVSPRLILLPTSPYSVLSPYSPTSPCSPHLPTSPIPLSSPQSPHNPFLSPPLPHLITTSIFTVASPLLPASPLSIFDRAISPTSPTFFLRRSASPGTPSWSQPTFLRTTTPRMADVNGRDGESPTFLQPRTPPIAPQARKSIDGACGESGEWEGLARRGSFAKGPTYVGGEATNTERKELKVEFYHFLAAKRAAAINRFSASSSIAGSSSWVRRSWSKLRPRVKVEEIQPLPSRRSRFSVWGGVGSRA